MTPIEKAAAYVVNLATAEIGYKEKATNAQLTDKDANAGSGNWTKYAAYFDAMRGEVEFYNGKENGFDWCDMFFDWLQCQAWGIEDGRKVLYQPERSCGAGCAWSASYYRNNGAWHSDPLPGDQIFFGPKGNESHTGLVAEVTPDVVITIEGNAANMVQRRSYSRNNANIAGYGRPRYALVADRFKEQAPEPEKSLTQMIDERIEAYMGTMCKDINDIPWASVRKVMRKVLDAQAIDGGTPYEQNPDDIGMPLNSVRVLVGAVRYIEHSLKEAFKDD